MLSVLIPVYNFDIRDFVKSISDQSCSAGIDFEIIVMDDASEGKFKKINSEILSIPGVVYVEQKKNIGRSRIRNQLADLAKFDNYLFLDCDSKIRDEFFIKNYISQIDKNSVIYGGSVYQAEKPKDKRYLLHWLYGVKREVVSVSERTAEPNRSFKTNNFLISREAFDKVRFNEKIRGYGHEDTLFGYDLDKIKITIRHIDNPVYHIGLEPGEKFLQKTREGIKNLKRIMSINGNEKKLVKDIKILAYYKNLKSLHLKMAVSQIFKRLEPKLRKNLLSEKPNLFLFDIYKLGYLCSLNGDYNV